MNNQPFTSAGSVSVTFPAMVLAPTGNPAVGLDTAARLAPGQGYASASVFAQPPLLAGSNPGAKMVQRNKMAQQVGQAAKNFAKSPANQNPLAEHMRKGGCK